MTTALRGSRALLHPGPQPPVSHFGLSLMRHVVGTGLRYSLYQLGLPLPEKPPVVIVQLRLYLDAAAIHTLLQEAPAGERVATALLDPGCAEDFGATDGRLVAAAFVHRQRLRLRPGSGSKPVRSAGASWDGFREALTGMLPGLNEAFLAEIVTVLERFRDREKGHPTTPCLGPTGVALSQGRFENLARLGPPDPFLPAWNEETSRRRTEQMTGTAEGSGFRGLFRERYREALSALAPLYRSLAAQAVDRELLQDEDQAFFIPFDLAGDLDSETPLDWIVPAVESNRREYDNLERTPPPPDLIYRQPDLVAGPGRTPDFEQAVLWPLE